ncbi:hypothetical protein [Desulfopila aestuarii]|nr:hypothetical protein [Desulfopila aestuarii]
MLEKASGPAALVEIEQKGNVTVRAIRGWGRLPERFIRLGQELRRDSGFDLLAADRALLWEWISLADTGDGKLAAAREGLVELLGFMERGDYLDWQPIATVVEAETGSPLRQGGKRWIHGQPSLDDPAAVHPAENSEAVTLFAGEMMPEWLPYQADGGKFEGFATIGNGLMSIKVEAGHSWGRTGIRSESAMVEYPRGRQEAIRLTALFEPQATSDAIISLVPSSAKTDDEWRYHHVRVGMHLDKDEGPTTLTLWIARKTVMTREISGPLERFDLLLRPDDVVLVTDGKGKTLLQGVLPEEDTPPEGYRLYALTGSTSVRRGKPLRMALRSIQRVQEPFTAQFAPDSLPDGNQQITLFEQGVLGHLWVPTAGRGSVFATNASLDDGELMVDVPAGGHWGKVGIYSPGALVWLDRFSSGGEAAVTFEFDSARTTGFVVALSPLYNLVGNDPSRPHLWAQWHANEDGSAGRSMLFIKPDFPKTAWEGETSAAAPDSVTLRISPEGVLVEGLGAPQERFPWQVAMPNMGFRVYVFSHAEKAGSPVRMVLRRIQLDRQMGVEPPTPETAEKVEPLEVTPLFAGQLGELWEPYAVRGASFEEHGRFANSRLVAEVPEGKHSWRKVGIVSKTPVFEFNERILRTSYAVRLKCDPAGTSGVQAVFRSSKSADMEKGADVLASFVRHDTGRHAGRYVLSLSGENAIYRNWQRTVDATWVEQHWDGELEILFGNGWVETGIAGGPRVRGTELRTGKGWSYHMSVTTLPATPLGTARLTLANITGQWIAPDGMTAGERWQLVDDEDFDAGAFLDELAGELPGE